MNMSVSKALQKMLNQFKADNLIDEATYGKIISESSEVDDAIATQLRDEFAKKLDDATKEIAKKYQDAIGELSVKLGESEAKAAAKDDEDAPEKEEPASDDKEGDENGEGTEEPEGEEIPVSEGFKGFLANLPEENVASFNAFCESLNEDQTKLFATFLTGTMTIEPSVDDMAKAIGDIKGSYEFEEPEKLESILKPITESSRISSLVAKAEREQEKLIKNQLKALKRLNKAADLTGGTMGATRRLGNFDKLLVKTQRKLAMAEHCNQRLAAEKESMFEQLKALIDDNAQLINENNELGKKAKLLSESADNNEAKAYLTESVSGLPVLLRRHLLKKFDGASVTEIKENLNEAIEAFNDENRDLRSSLRSIKPDPTKIVNEAVIKPETEEIDPIVERFLSKNKA